MKAIVEIIIIIWTFVLAYAFVDRYVLCGPSGCPKPIFPQFQRSLQQWNQNNPVRDTVQNWGNSVQNWVQPKPQSSSRYQNIMNEITRAAQVPGLGDVPVVNEGPIMSARAHIGKGFIGVNESWMVSNLEPYYGKGSIYGVLAHEFGHLVHYQRGQYAGTGHYDENFADRYAACIMRKMGISVEPFADFIYTTPGGAQHPAGPDRSWRIKNRTNCSGVL